MKPKKRRRRQKAGGRRKNDAPPQGSESVAPDVIFLERLPDRTIHRCPAGQYFFRGDSVRLVRRMVLQAACHLGHPFPSVAVFDRAELFYRENVPVGIRVDGEYPVGVGDGGEIEKRRWSTPEGPQFTLLNDYGILMDPSDEGGAYVAVLNMSFGVLVRWDLSMQYDRGEMTAGDLNRQCHKLLFPEEVNLDPDETPSLQVPDTLVIRTKARHLEAKSLHLTFVPRPPANSGKLLIFKASDDHRTLIYIADQAWVEYELARTYAMSQSISREELKKYAAEGDWTLEKAKLLWVRQGFSEQAVFVREGLEAIHELNDKRLWDVFETTLGSSLYEAAFANWEPLGSVKKKTPEDMLEPTLRREQNNLKKSLGMRGRGRSRRTVKEKDEALACRERKIRSAVMKVCEAAKKAGKDVVVAEDLLTPSAVAEKVGKTGRHTSTLYRWLSACGLDFEQIKSDCLRQVFSRR